MIDEYLTNGTIFYSHNIFKDGNISKDMFKINYREKEVFLLCTFDGFKLINTLLIS